MQSKSKIILGIDPGTIMMGYGLIKVENKTPEFLMMDVLKLNGKSDPYQRLQLIHQKVIEIIEEFQPTHFAIEAPFFGKNVQSMLKLGRAQGVAISAAIFHGLEVIEYSPKKVKQSITGNGNASKEQVLKMLQQTFKTEIGKNYLDASDALAVALCHWYQLSSPLSGGEKKVKDWKSFIAQNPQKVL